MCGRWRRSRSAARRWGCRGVVGAGRRALRIECCGGTGSGVVVSSTMMVSGSRNAGQICPRTTELERHVVLVGRGGLLAVGVEHAVEGLSGLFAIGSLVPPPSRPGNNKRGRAGTPSSPTGRSRSRSILAARAELTSLHVPSAVIWLAAQPALIRLWTLLGSAACTYCCVGTFAPSAGGPGGRTWHRHNEDKDWRSPPSKTPHRYRRVGAARLLLGRAIIKETLLVPGR